jgi:hypothetical protein
VLLPQAQVIIPTEPDDVRRETINTKYCGHGSRIAAFGGVGDDQGG